MLIALHAYLLGFPALFSIVDPISGALISRAATVQWPRDTHPRLARLVASNSFVMMTGVFSTLLIPETKQRTLEDLSNEDQERYITGTTSTREAAVPLASMSTESRWV